MSPIVLIGGSVFLLGIGAGLGYLLALRLLARDAKAVGEVQEELDEYRRQVSEHFGETAQHFQALGKQYQFLYRHLAQGAGTLCDPTQSNALLEFSEKDAELVAPKPQGEAEAVPDAPIDYVAEPDSVTAELQPEVDVTEVAEPPVEVAAAEVAETAGPSAQTDASDDVTSGLQADEDVSTEPAPPRDAVEGERTVH